MFGLDLLQKWVILTHLEIVGHSSETQPQVGGFFFFNVALHRLTHYMAYFE